MRYLLLAVGEAFDAPLGNTSALLTAESRLLLDCGYALPASLWAHDGDPAFLDGIYISHAHGDHYFGWPPVIGRLWESGRTRELAIITQEPVHAKLRDAMELAYPGILAKCQFPIRFVPAAHGAAVRWREFDLS